MKIVIIDGSLLAHRTYHVLPIKRDKYETEAEYRNVMRMAMATTVIQSIALIIADAGATHAIVPLDLNDEVPEGSESDIKYELINELRFWLYVNLPRIGIGAAGCAGIEADELAYYLASIPNKLLYELLGCPGYEGVCDLELHSGDTDWLQSIDNQRTVVDPKSKQRFDKKWMEENYGQWYKAALVTIKCLVGEDSDGIEGVYGVGPTYAKQCKDLLSDPIRCLPLPKEQAEQNLTSAGLIGYAWAKGLLERYDKFIENWGLIDLARNTYGPANLKLIQSVVHSGTRVLREPPGEIDVLVAIDGIRNYTESKRLGSASQRIIRYTEQLRVSTP